MIYRWSHAHTTARAPLYILAIPKFGKAFWDELLVSNDANLASLSAMKEECSEAELHNQVGAATQNELANTESEEATRFDAWAAIIKDISRPVLDGPYLTAAARYKQLNLTAVGGFLALLQLTGTSGA
jgi:hypothetical protein